MLADVGHIVVVDDDPSLRRLVIRYLEDHNIPTKPASNRTELNRHLNGTVPSLIILDLRLGQDDGLDMLREIRSHSDVPVTSASSAGRLVGSNCDWLRWWYSR